METPSVVSRVFARAATAVDEKLGWDRLPLPLSLLTLIGLRDALREDNLYDTYEGDAPEAPARASSEYLTVRTVDGSYNDLDAPSMGMAHTRFGRNVPLQKGHAEEAPELFEPNPLTVSDELLVRREFKPATTLNVLAAAWLQFETRDWFSHGTDPDRLIEVPRPEGDGSDEGPMLVPRTPADPTATADHPVRTFVNTETSWWDASQVYGSTEPFQKAVRTGDRGRVRIGADGLIDVDPAQLAS